MCPSAEQTSPASTDPVGYNRSACTECQRRKQKCNREWPCERCQRRKIADQCTYTSSNVPLAPASALETQGNHRLEAALLPNSSPVRSLPLSSSPSTDHPDAELAVEDSAFDALAATRLFVALGLEPQETSTKASPQEDYANEPHPPQLERVLELLPQRQTMDKLISSFTHDVNYHYYIVYPPLFLRHYHIWWDRRSENRSITFQFTCLLAMICSCCIQHADDLTQQALERETRQSAESLSELLHNAVRELASVIPVGHYHMFNVQRLLHSCYWYKAEARFLEAWHVLSAAILEAKELAYHKEPPPGAESDLDRELRRRIWCILDTWDWQISSGLSRPKIIDRSDCNAQLPELTLEPYSVSPLLHMKLQSQLTRKLAARFSAPKNIVKPPEVEEYKAIIEAWMRSFPAVYDFDAPETSMDGLHSWIVPHRYYLYTMACLLILNPIRHYMVKSYTRESPAEELSIRADGVHYSLKLMKTLRTWVDAIYNRDGRLHFIIFSIFDTAAILCTAILKDTMHMLTRKGEIWDAIADALAMLEQLNTISKTSKTSYDILYRLTKKLPQPMLSPADFRRKRAKMVTVSDPAPEPVFLPEPVLVPEPAHASAKVLSAAGRPAMGARADLHLLPQSNYAPTALLPRVAAGGHDFAVGVGGAVAGGSGGGGGGGGGGVGLEPASYSVYSTCSEDTPNSNDDLLLSSLSTAGDVAAVPPPAVVLTDGMLPPPAGDPSVADFELESLTQADLGELAPIWAWHSMNLDFGRTAEAGLEADMPPPL